MAEYIEREALLHKMKMDIRPPFAVARDFPAADVAPVVHGTWIGKPISGFATVRCSVCRETFSENSGRWKFCPKCGARMLEDE